MQNFITYAQLSNFELEILIRRNYKLTYSEQQQIHYILSQIHQNFTRLQELSHTIQPEY